jgi:hypothetical protein
VHQTALYDFIIAAGIFLFLRWLSRHPRREGIMIMSFAIIYGAGRVVTDFLRVDKTYFGLTGSQVTSIGVILLSLFTLWRYSRRPLPEPEPAIGLEPGEHSGALGSEAAEPAGDEAPATTDFSPPPQPGPGPPHRDEPPVTSEPERPADPPA